MLRNKGPEKRAQSDHWPAGTGASRTPANHAATPACLVRQSKAPESKVRIPARRPRRGCPMSTHPGASSAGFAFRCAKRSLGLVQLRRSTIRASANPPAGPHPRSAPAVRRRGCRPPATAGSAHSSAPHRWRETAGRPPRPPGDSQITRLSYRASPSSVMKVGTLPKGFLAMISWSRWTGFAFDGSNCTRSPRPSSVRHHQAFAGSGREGRKVRSS